MTQHELKRTIKMQTKFKDIAQYYLGTGLEIRHNDGDDLIMNATGSGSNFISIDDIEEYGKPLLRSLDSLTKPITVKGYNDSKEFVPSEKLSVHLFDFDFIDMVVNKRNTNGIPFWVVKLLLQWHFNIFGLEETEYIKID